MRAGVRLGNDKREFKSVTQGERYDPFGDFIAAWVPELALYPPSLRHRPWNLTIDVKTKKDHGKHSHIFNEKNIQSISTISCSKENHELLRSPLWRIKCMLDSLFSQIHESKIDNQGIDLNPLHGTVDTIDRYPGPMVDPSSQIGRKRAK